MDTVKPDSEDGLHPKQLRITKEIIGAAMTAEALARAYIATGEERFRVKGRALLEICLRYQDTTGRFIQDGSWPDRHRVMPYRNANMLQHLPVLMAVLSR